MTIVLSVILWLRLLISPLVSSDHWIISHSTITSSNFPYGIFWPLNYQSFFDYVFWFPIWYLLTIELSDVLRLRLLISPLLSFCHCVISHSLITSSNVPLVSYDHCIISHSLITPSNFPFDIFRPLYYQSFFDYVF